MSKPLFTRACVLHRRFRLVGAHSSDWNEADYEDPEFQNSHWGPVVYARLLRLKKVYDPAGLFFGHHSVGSELWSADGNCRV